MHKINPVYGVDIKITIEAKFTDKEGKEKSKCSCFKFLELFILNILNILFNSYLSKE